jgi:DNA repair protein RecO (recombination protein O)
MAVRERVNLEPAYVLHHREYRDTSRILDVFSERHGRITLFARGARGPKSRLAPLLMPFRPLLVSWTGRGEAAQLTGAETAGDAMPIPSAHIMSAFYLNELLINLTTRHDPQPQLFADYARALHRLGLEGGPDAALRVF